MLLNGTMKLHNLYDDPIIPKLEIDDMDYMNVNL